MLWKHICRRFILQDTTDLKNRVNSQKWSAPGFGAAARMRNNGGQIACDSPRESQYDVNAWMAFVLVNTTRNTSRIQLFIYATSTKHQTCNQV